jgi:hypothetical protein
MNYVLSPSDRAYLAEIGIPQADIERTHRAHFYMRMRNGMSRPVRIGFQKAAQKFGHNAVLRAMYRAAVRTVDSIRSEWNDDLILIIKTM